MAVEVRSFYQFKDLSGLDLEQERLTLTENADHCGVRGLLIMAREGVNATLSGSWAGLDRFLEFMHSRLNLTPPEIKKSWTERHPFANFKAKIRPEIVTLGKTDFDTTTAKSIETMSRRLSPQDWQKALSDDSVVVLDTRNTYEIEIGKFKTAQSLKLEEFSQFPEALKASQISTDQKVLIYCTGGIRCEKAILEMDQQGFKNVYQLDGGILNYLKAFPNQDFEGECFVFDHRVAVKQDLEPTESFRLCPHCGQPAKEKISCVQCNKPDVVCAHCLSESEDKKTCSKNCAHHFRMGHRSRRKHSDSYRHRGLDSV